MDDPHGRLLDHLYGQMGSVRYPDTEALCMATLALLGGEPRHKAKAVNLIWCLQALQWPDGSWPPTPGAEVGGAFATALATITLARAGSTRDTLKAAVSSLLRDDCREAQWLWRWKLRAVDDKVRFNPSKYGWGWVPDTVSWVIPTSFAVIALEQLHDFNNERTHEIRNRIDLAREMLLDRACPGGGWNPGNAMVYGVPLRPHLDATSVALLALLDRVGDERVVNALRYVSATVLNCPSPYSVAWVLLALLLFRGRDALPDVDRAVGRGVKHLLSIAGMETDISTIAVCCLALDAMAGGRHVFQTARD
jgi:hypothetical protein